MFDPILLFTRIPKFQIKGKDRLDDYIWDVFLNEGDSGEVNFDMALGIKNLIIDLQIIYTICLMLK